MEVIDMWWACIYSNFGISEMSDYFGFTPI